MIPFLDQCSHPDCDECCTVENSSALYWWRPSLMRNQIAARSVATLDGHSSDRHPNWNKNE
jgi:hypothetical protein